MFQPRNKPAKPISGHPFVLGSQQSRAVPLSAKESSLKLPDTKVREPGVFYFNPLRLLVQFLIVAGLLLRAAYRYQVPLVVSTVDTVAFKYLKMGEEEFSYGQIIMFGDSITQQSWMPDGTGAALQDVYQRKL